MTPRQKEFFQYCLETISDQFPKGNRTEAYRKVYGIKETDTPEKISKKASKVWNRIIGNEELKEVFKKFGLDAPMVAAQITTGLKATKPLVYQGKIMKDEEGNPIELPDNQMRTAILLLLTNILGFQQKHNAGNIMVQNNRLIVYVHDEEAPPLTAEQERYKKEAEKRIRQARNYIVQENEEEKETDEP